MMPLERPIQRSALLKHILELNALTLLLVSYLCCWLWRDIRFNRLPLWIRHCWRCMRLAPRLLALFLLSLCLAQLYHLMIRRPRKTHINSFDDLLNSDLHVFGLRAEFDMLTDDFRARYAAAFRLTDNLAKFFAMRNSLNTSWAYSITSTKWIIYEELQRYFKRPLFKYSDICLQGNNPDSILLTEDSIYRDVLKLYTMRVQQSGLLLHWMQQSFYDMVKAGKMQLKDYSIQIPMRPLNVQDFEVAWHCCCLGFGLALFVFGVELLRFYVNVCLNHL